MTVSRVAARVHFHVVRPYPPLSLSFSLSCAHMIGACTNVNIYTRAMYPARKERERRSRAVTFILHFANDVQSDAAVDKNPLFFSLTLSASLCRSLFPRTARIIFQNGSIYHIPSRSFLFSLSLSFFYNKRWIFYHFFVCLFCQVPPRRCAGRRTRSIERARGRQIGISEARNNAIYDPTFYYPENVVVDPVARNDYRDCHGVTDTLSPGWLTGIVVYTQR